MARSGPEGAVGAPVSTRGTCDLSDPRIGWRGRLGMVEWSTVDRCRSEGRRRICFASRTSNNVGCDGRGAGSDALNNKSSGRVPLEQVNKVCLHLSHVIGTRQRGIIVVPAKTKTRCKYHEKRKARNDGKDQNRLYPIARYFIPWHGRKPVQQHPALHLPPNHLPPDQHHQGKYDPRYPTAPSSPPRSPPPAQTSP